MTINKKTKKFTLNDNDREEWIDNDEGLYSWYRSSRKSMREFIRNNRTDIDAHIKAVLGYN